MTFITSRDAIDSLMGPAIRTQAVTPAVSPRQQRLRAAVRRSTSDPNIRPTYGISSRAMSDRAVDCPLSSVTDDHRAPGRPNNDASASSDHILGPPLLQSSYSPTVSHSNNAQPRRRRSKQSLYHSSIDLSSRTSLAPVIETETSPVEEKPLPQLSVASPPRSRTINETAKVTGLGISISRSTPDLPLYIRPARTPNNESNVLHKSNGPASGIYLNSTANSSLASIASLEEEEEDGEEVAAAREARLNTVYGHQSVHATTATTRAPTTRTSLRHGTVSHDALDRDVEKLSTEISTLFTSKSSPELTSAASFSSEEECPSRSSMSSVSSTECVAMDRGEHPTTTATSSTALPTCPIDADATARGTKIPREVDLAYAVHVAALAASTTGSQQQSRPVRITTPELSVRKTSQLLGPESPNLQQVGGGGSGGGGGGSKGLLVARTTTTTSSTFTMRDGNGNGNGDARPLQMAATAAPRRQTSKTDSFFGLSWSRKKKVAIVSRE